jgi:hypothetical protein
MVAPRASCDKPGHAWLVAFRGSRGLRGLRRRGDHCLRHARRRRLHRGSLEAHPKGTLLGTKLPARTFPLSCVSHTDCARSPAGMGACRNTDSPQLNKSRSPRVPLSRALFFATTTCNLPPSTSCLSRIASLTRQASTNMAALSLPLYAIWLQTGPDFVARQAQSGSELTQAS